MLIREVENVNEARECDKLLTKLIQTEREFNSNIDEAYKVNNYYENLYQKKNNAIFVAIDKKVIAYLYIKITTSLEDPTLNHEALIDGIYVEEEYRGQKIAKKLIDEAKKWAISKEVKYIALSVLTKNEVAKKVYYDKGFEDFSITLRQSL